MAEEQTLEERVAALEETVAALAAEGEYTVNYSGEDVDSLLDGIDTALEVNTAAELRDTIKYTKAVAETYKSARLSDLADFVNEISSGTTSGQIVTAANNTFHLVMKWDSVSFEYSVSQGATVWQSNTFANAIPNGLNGYIILAGNDGGSHTQNAGFITAQTGYRVNSRDLTLTTRLYHEHSETKTGTMKVSYLLVGLSTGGGAIG